ncbi:MAG: hypothetical protein A3E87_08505 [Gammaproteobacteria bacterium RIFCSPHIGHO2_12_FULL_35_23]|nr:MAG: hypothetical protein A3E87_08505 [Gammaproteobacteria bacterium RIFCSPHIGHO2_12_FULL_35_23]
MPDLMTLMTMQEKYQPTLLSLHGVEGIGIGSVSPDSAEQGLIIYTSRELVQVGQIVMRDGEQEVKVRFIQTGAFVANGALPLPTAMDAKEYKARVRPASAGYSVGHTEAGIAGSAGLVCAMLIKHAGQYVTLPLTFSNKHVCIHDNQQSEWPHIVQPGSADGGQDEEDRVGKSYLAWSLQKKDDNFEDCAAYYPVPYQWDRFTGVYPGVGVLKEAWWAFTNQLTGCLKVGRTTGKVYGEVEAFNVTLKVNYEGYGDLGTITFKQMTVVLGKEDQAVSLPGDSGSTWVAPYPGRSGEYVIAGINFAGPADGKRSISFSFGPKVTQLQEEGTPLIPHDWSFGDKCITVVTPDKKSQLIMKRMAESRRVLTKGASLFQRDSIGEAAVRHLVPSTPITYFRSKL